MVFMIQFAFIQKTALVWFGGRRQQTAHFVTIIFICTTIFVLGTRKPIIVKPMLVIVRATISFLWISHFCFSWVYRDMALVHSERTHVNLKFVSKKQYINRFQINNGLENKNISFKMVVVVHKVINLSNSKKMICPSINQSIN